MTKCTEFKEKVDEEIVDINSKIIKLEESSEEIKIKTDQNFKGISKKITKVENKVRDINLGGVQQ